MIEHRLQAVTTHIALTRAVYRVAELHVVSRHGLGDSPGRASNLEKPAGGYEQATDLEVFLAVRGNGLKIEMPAVSGLGLGSHCRAT